ncbi:alpha-L-rhamnosidase C-terminal domain-containing protein [Flavisolibacter ginsenosidimutans]|uniref:Bacterial alpha-L-rhamnosidase n=1 Tax=Flavisolibacter ginsenosidimutans TaxID=661481 RepID=A0A5B8UMI6_9BACT|nr:alpha-L-rhamnosidase C-terminal domain-containing protein [Flavisolibacter ginsenosidimutans]QEC57280.1 Bacterial alpha-L-rhamnosidase [Flavisolibacter ginsenosidimutans]
MRLLGIKNFLLSLSSFCFFLQASAQLPPVFSATQKEKIAKDEISRYYIAPQRIVWTNDSTQGIVTNAQLLLQKGTGQPYFGAQAVCKFINKKGYAGLVLDFGKQIHGGLQITTSQSNRVTRKVRIRFGESVSETMSDVIGDGTTGLEGGATNHHAMRDFIATLPGYGTLEIGNSGFRFARIDLVEADSVLALKEVRAVLKIRDLPYLGSFRCSDERLNQIWLTGAYTVQLNMQDYLWDGIKRDRMVWLGDMHPEIMTISNVFGYNDIVPKSLDFVRDHTPLPNWMNGISAYSMWWVIIQHDWYMFHGRLDYLKQQKAYLLPLLDLFMSKVDAAGKENIYDKSFRFLDWPSSENKGGVHAGLQALMVMTFEKAAVLCDALNETTKAKTCREMVTKMKRYVPDANGSKQAASLMALAGIIPAAKANADVISVGGAKNFSTFFGYYMLQAQAKAGDYETALNNIRSYWGGMLDMGATTFWEDFNLEEAANAGRIDEVVPAGKKDFHRDCGAYCYIGLRRSLCHGWASGPTPWLTENVLGIKVLSPGCKVIKIEPHLGDLGFAEGSFPTPYGVVKVKHTKSADGKIKTEVQAPKEIKITRAEEKTL